MNWYKELYFGKTAGKKKRKLIRKLESGKVVFGVYVIMISSGPADILDILPAFMLFREDNRERRIIGLAVSKEEAYEVCEKIISDVFCETGGYDIRSYFA